jgi:hypothetical protein
LVGDGLARRKGEGWFDGMGQRERVYPPAFLLCVLALLLVSQSGGGIEAYRRCVVVSSSLREEKVVDSESLVAKNTPAPIFHPNAMWAHGGRAIDSRSLSKAFLLVG